MDLFRSAFCVDTRADQARTAAKVASILTAANAARYLSWRVRINRSIPGPPDSLLLGAGRELYNAGLNDFWGFNPRLFKSLFARYGKMVRFWLPGSGLFVACYDIDDIAELNKKCVARPDLVETLLPYLGYDNLLFQKGAMVKNLRLRYGQMVNDRGTLQQVNDVAIALLDERSADWSKRSSVDLHEALDTIIYDVMGQVVFGGNWTEAQQGEALRKEHLWLIKWSSRLGIEFLMTPSWHNLWKAPSDYRRFFASVRRLRAIAEGMLQKQRQAIDANPAKFENDKTALTMLVTNKVSASDPKPFFSTHLAVSTCLGFLNGAFDTTHATTFWIFYHLARFPEEQKKLRDEIDKAVPGARMPTREALLGCKRLEAFIRESMRLRPTVPLGMRVPEEDVTIGGVHIPRGTSVLPFLDVLEGTERHFGPEPQAFRPDRFLGDGEAAKTARQKFDRFGGHARMCVGMTFAIAELNAMIARAIQLFEIELKNPESASAVNPEMIYEAGVYQPKEHFHFVFKAR